MVQSQTVGKYGSSSNSKTENQHVDPAILLIELVTGAQTNVFMDVSWKSIHNS